MSAPVSIIINNYNYAQFLADAIESALAQTHRPLEVLVVDDGSTDDSRAVIAGFGSRVRAILTENRGQGSAFNAGFAQCSGEIVIFLDADDRLLPDTAARVVEVMDANPEVARVQYRMRVIDRAGTPTGELMPPAGQALLSGDVRAKMLAFPDDLPWQPTSGNAFTARALRQVLPMPEAPYRICADYHLLNLTSLCGRVAALDQPGVEYRVHGSNNEFAEELCLKRLRQNIERTTFTHRELIRFARGLQLEGLPQDPLEVRSVTYLANRLISWRLEPALHPIRHESRLGLFWRGVRAIAGRSDLGPVRRVVYVGWFAAMVLAPRAFVPRLVGVYLDPNGSKRAARRVAGPEHQGSPELGRL